MEAVRPIPLRSIEGDRPTIRLADDRIVIESLVLADRGLAAFLAERPPDDRPGLVERALRIGLLALQDAGVTIDVEFVRREFETLVRQTEVANERAATALDRVLRDNFADGDGRLPRTLERFLGDRGALRHLVDELFDERKRDSAIGRLRELLGSYFDGDASRLARLLDPTREGSPLHQFRGEVSEGFARIGERLAALEAAGTARAAERTRSSAKGTDFEELLADLLGDIARGAGDLLDRTSTEAGTAIRSKKGDFVLSLDPRLSRGADLRIVVEAKDRAISARAIRDELREARENRDAAIGLVVFTPAHAPSGVEPFTVVGNDVYCVVDPEAPDRSYLEAAVRLCRMLALATLRETQIEVDSAAISTAVTGIREQLEVVRTMKSQLTSVGNATRTVADGLDRLREGILARVCEVEAELRVAAPASAGGA
jgi:hypothetical protein